MSTIVFVWELGAGLGHLAQLRPVMQTLAARGHSVYLISKDVALAEQVLDADTVRVLQAPILLKQPKESVPARCFSDILIYKGFGNPEALVPMVRAWLELFELIDPDAIVFDHSPTAMIAARGRRACRFIYSTAFLTPPQGADHKSLSLLVKDGDRRIAASANKVVDVVNRTAEKLPIEPITSIGDIYQVQKCFVVGCEQTDIYANKRDSNVFYTQPPENIGEVVDSDTEFPEVFVYLKKSAGERVQDVLVYLGHCGKRVTCFYSGASESECKALQTPTLNVFNKPLDMSLMCERADQVVCHAGSGSVNTAFKHGCSVFALPLQTEQLNNAMGLYDSGVGMYIAKDKDSSRVIEALGSFLSNDHYTSKAKEQAAKISSVDQANALECVLSIEYSAKQARRLK